MTDEFTIDLAVVIGISSYHRTVGPLETPARDAEAVAHLLGSRFGYEVILQCDGTATLAGLRTLLKDLSQRLQAGSRLLIYFAGHGVAQDSAELEGPKGYLVPHGATSSIDTHLPMRELYEALAALPCRHLLVILDCCFSGSFRWADRRPLSVPAELLYEERYRHWVRHPARWVLASSAHDEYALDTAGRRRGEECPHSPFAAALLDGLAGEADTRPQGGDGIVTLAELYAYVQDRLVPHQSPLAAPLPGQARGEFVFRDLERWQPLVSAEQAVHLDESQNPYRGLKPYRAEHAELFFGRSEATGQLLRHFHLHPLTVVVGPSGSGKSSLVQAGLSPILDGHPDESWTVPAPLRVTGDPFAALHGALAAAAGPLPPSAAQLRDSPEAVRAWSAAWMAARPSERLLIVVDQAEELVTHVIPAGTEAAEVLPVASAGFLACLATLLENGDGRLHALVVVRSDYEPDLEEGPLAARWSAGRFVIPLWRREELRQVIEGPAGCKALYFDDPRLVDRLADEVVGMPGGLPLLSYALSRLYLAYLRSGRGDRLLTAGDFAAIGGEPPPKPGGVVAPGGIVRILRVEADRAARELPVFHGRTLWRILLRTVNLVGARPTRRQVPLAELDFPQSGENDRVAEVLRRFIDEERLLVSDRASDFAPGSRSVVEPAHDELLVAWPQLVRRIDAARELLPVHRRLTEAAVSWVAGTANPKGERRRRRDLDLRLLGLVEASGLPEEGLNRHETEYVAAARSERRRRTGQRWAALVAALLLTTGAALFFRYQSSVARSRELAALALTTDQRDRGLLLAEAAYRVRPTLEARATLFSLLATLRHAQVFLHGHSPGVRSVAISPDGTLVAAGGDGGRIVIWDLSRPGRPRWSFDPPRVSPKGLWNEVHALDFSGDGKELVGAYEWGGVRIWRLSTAEGRPVAGWPRFTPGTRRVSTNWYGADPEPPEQRGERPATALALDRPGRRAVVGDFTGRLFGVDLTTSTILWKEQLFYGIDAIALVPRESAVVAADRTGHLSAIVPGSGAALPFSAQPHSSRLVVLRYLPQKNRLLSLDSTGLLVLWKRSASGFTVEEKAALPVPPLAAELDLARGRLLVAASSGEIRSFSLETRTELAREALQGHGLTPLAIRCSDTYPRCASGGVGDEVLVWNLRRAHPLLETTGQISERLAEDLIEIGAQDREAKVRAVSDGRVLIEEPNSREVVSLGLADPEAGDLNFIASSRFVAGVNRLANRLFVWQREHPEKPFLDVRLDGAVSALRFSPDGRFLSAGERGGMLMRWDLTRTPPPQRTRRVSPGAILALVFSPDGSLLFTGSGAPFNMTSENLAESDRHIRLWDPSSLQLIRELPERHTSSILEIRVSPNSRLLASAASDGEVILWDTNTWRAIGSLPTTLPPNTPPGEPPTTLQVVAFNRQSTRLVTATDDQLWIWRIRDEDLLEKACQIANRTMTPDEWDQSVGGARPRTRCGSVPSLPSRSQASWWVSTSIRRRLREIVE